MMVAYPFAQPCCAWHAEHGTKVERNLGGRIVAKPERFNHLISKGLYHTLKH